MRVGIVGGGASGLSCAIRAKSKSNEVIVYEKNNKCGKKILITGNGKCNYFNDEFNINKYNSQNIDILSEIINLENKNLILSFFEQLGVVPKVSNGYYYPVSNQAVTILQSLMNEAISKGVEIANELEVLDINVVNGKYEIITSKGKDIVDVLVLSTGSKATPKTGSDGFGYGIARKLGYNIIKPLPALVQLEGNEKYFKDWAGIRTDVEVSLYENDIFVKKEIGEIQLTDYGVSGICIYQLSSKLIRGLNNGNKEIISINFLPWLKEDITIFFENRNNKLKNRTISDLLDGMLNYKLVNLILKKNNIDSTLNYNELDNKQKEMLFSDLLRFKINIIDYKKYDNAQVCSGGVSLLDINIDTMESKHHKNFYIIGELLDVDGDCGGYNLGFAWLSGILAGDNIRSIYD